MGFSRIRSDSGQNIWLLFSTIYLANCHGPLYKWGMNQPKNILAANGAGVAWTVTAATMYAAMNAAAKVGAGHLTLWQIGVSRYFFGTLVLLMLAPLLKINLWGSHRVLQIIRALGGVAGFLLMVEAFTTIPISEASILFYSWPAFGSLFSHWVLGESTTKWEWPFIATAFVGAGIILWPEKGIGELAFGHLLALSAAVCASIVMLLVRRLARDNHAMSIYFYLCLVGSIVCMIPWLGQAASGEATYLPQDNLGWSVLLIMALPSVLSHIFLNQGFRYLRAPQVGVLMTLELPLLAAFGVFYLGEPMGWRLLSGAGLIMASGIVLTLKPGASP
jgi:drug/metabolite transporter (DMT)-like permease